MNKNVNISGQSGFSQWKKNYEIAAPMNQTFEKATLKKKTETWDFPGSPVVEILPFQCNRLGFDPWSENEDHAAKKRKKKFERK